MDAELQAVKEAGKHLGETVAKAKTDVEAAIKDFKAKVDAMHGVTEQTYNDIIKQALSGVVPNLPDAKRIPE